MSVVNYEPPDPIPVAKDNLEPQRDFCASMVDTSLSTRDNPITKLIVDIAHPVVDDEAEYEIETEIAEEMATASNE